MSKVLITGGAGFIGTHVGLNLHSKGHEALAYDNFSNYIDPYLSHYHPYLNVRLGWLKNKVRVMRGDIRSPWEMTKTMQDFQPDIIIHLAAIADARASNTFSEEASAINLDGTLNVLEAIRAVKTVKRFVFASTSFIYGDFKTEVVDETHATQPKDVYGGTKLSGECLTESYGKRFGIEYVIVRPSAVYGPTDANRRVSQIFIEDALKGKTLNLEGGAANRLDFTFVEDIAQGFVLAATQPGVGGNTFNVTYGQSRSLLDYVNILRKYIPEIKVAEKPADPTRPKRGTLDIGKARQKLGYEPKYPLEAGIEKYFKFVKEHESLLK